MVLERLSLFHLSYWGLLCLSYLFLASFVAVFALSPVLLSAVETKNLVIPAGSLHGPLSF